MTAPSHPPARLAWGVWGLGAALYVVGFFHRVAPAVITGELSAEFGLSATALGNLSAFYFFSYVAMQVPTGILADRWGPRRLLTAGALVAAAGTLAFALAPALWVASAGRLLVGGSVAVAFVGMLEIAGHWIAPRRFALASGMALLTGIAGAVLAGVPLRLLVDRFGWRPVMAASAAGTLLLAAAIWSFVRDDPRERGHRSHHVGGDGEGVRSVLGGLVEVLRYRNTWLLSIVPGGVVGALLTFAGLWGVPWLTAAYRLTTAEAAGVTSLLLVAWALGGPAFGALSDRLGRRKPLYVAGVGVVALAWALVLYGSPPRDLLLPLLLVAGFGSGCMAPGFAFAKESVPPSLAGTVSGVVNTGVMVGPMVLQPSVGWVLDRLWSGTVQGGVRVYELSSYRAGFGLVMAWLALSLALIPFARETGCRQLPGGPGAPDRTPGRSPEHGVDRP
ncbi:MAG TPA: MFS transporter [Anaeromyxobacteraceae bacterium]|nr:MFS transporter [Anaeromyxobacteraceae bacterium]